MEWLSLLPPALAITIAIWKREVIVALLAALFVSEWLLASFHPALGFTGTLERIVSIFGDGGNTRILLFSLLIGALLAYIRDFGGVSAFVNWIKQRNIADTPRKVGLLPTLTGMAIFIESNMSVLTAGIVSQNLFDKFSMSRARLAYIIDSTCAPVSVLILLNGWGAYVLGLLDGYGLENKVGTLVESIPLNFYAILTLVVVLYTVLSNKVYGPLKASEAKLDSSNREEPPEATKVGYMMWPLATMIFGIIAMMWITGDGNIMAGSGSRSVLWSVALALVVAYLLLRFDGKVAHKKLVKHGFKGMSELLPLVATVLLALALGASLRELGTGTFVASALGEFLPGWTITPLVFLAAALISFTTGTSWGTFGLLIPIAIPLAETFGLPPALLISAVLGGGVFGDHTSPISDSTIISSLASGCELLEHVKTQLPYALFTGGLTVIIYALIGIFY